MIKIIDTFRVGKNTALILSENVPNIAFKKVRIDGKNYKPKIIYEIDNAIAVESDEDLKGKTIEFIR